MALKSAAGGWRRAAAALLLTAAWSLGQTLRFDAYRPAEIPEYANIRIGPFFSDAAFSQSVSYRYIRTGGTGASYLFEKRLGRIRQDGSDFPLESSLSLRNYLWLTPRLDLDISVRLGYRYFPMDTEDNEFVFDAPDLGLSARMGAFTFTLTEDTWIGTFTGDRVAAYTGEEGRGFSANVGSEFEITPYTRGRVYDALSLRDEYIDGRGIADGFSGRKYRYWQNTIGADYDWLMAKTRNLSLSANRTDTIPEGEEFDRQRSVIYRAHAQYTEQVTPLVQAGGMANFTWRDYLRTARGDQFQQDYLGFLGLQLTERSAFRGGAGHSSVTLTHPGAYEWKGRSDAVVGYARLDSQLAERLSHGIELNRSQIGGFDSGVELQNVARYELKWANPDLSVGFTTWYRDVEPRLTTATPYTDWSSQLNLSKPLTRLLTLHASTAYGVRDNGEATGAAPYGDDPFLADDYQTWLTTVGLTHTLAQNLTLSAYVTHTERFSDNPNLAFTRDAFQVTAVYTHDF